MRPLIVVCLLVAAAVGGAWAYAARYPALPPVSTPPAASFPRDRVETGAALANLGACENCHTRTGGQPFAGGRPFDTPFGTVHATNITPDGDTGIGSWSQAAFVRAMREGVDAAGRHLYPVFPYDHFAKATDDDLGALYAFMMTRRAVRAPNSHNDMRFPFDRRVLLAGWKLLFHDPRPFVPDPARDATIDRGAYLVAGLGHCGACHSPRNSLGAVRTQAGFAGGIADGWHAPALGPASKARVPWTEAALINYLTDGWDAHHGVAAGPMTAVVDNLAKVPAEMITAMARHLVALGAPQGRTAEAEVRAARERDVIGARPPAPGSAPLADAAVRGEAIFALSCASCHRRGGPAVPMALYTAVQIDDPRNVINSVLHGIRPPVGAPERSMPRFAGSLDDAQLADLLVFVRSRFTDGPAWTDLPARIAQRRRQH